MPFKSNSQFDSLIAMTALLSDDELHALADKCKNLAADRERIRRNELREEVTKNLQMAIDDVLTNGFNLTIENVDNPSWAVQLLPDEIYRIEIE